MLFCCCCCCFGEESRLLRRKKKRAAAAESSEEGGGKCIGRPRVVVSCGLRDESVVVSKRDKGVLGECVISVVFFCLSSSEVRVVEVLLSLSQRKKKSPALLCCWLVVV